MTDLSTPASDIVPETGPEAVAHVYATDGRQLASQVVSALPRVPVLRSLGDDLLRARRDVAFPNRDDLVDPDRFWAVTLWPRVESLVDGCRAILAGIESRLETIVAATGVELDGWVTELVWTMSEQGGDPATNRPAAIDEIAARCQALHESIEATDPLRPGVVELRSVQAELAEHRRRQAVTDVKRQRKEYLATVGPDPAHQKWARSEWDAGVDARHTHRDAELRTLLPWRHQELALAAHEQVITLVEHEVAAMAARRVEPIFAIGEQLIQRYDAVATGRV